MAESKLNGKGFECKERMPRWGEVGRVGLLEAKVQKELRNLKGCKEQSEAIKTRSFIIGVTQQEASFEKRRTAGI